MKKITVLLFAVLVLSSIFSTNIDGQTINGIISGNVADNTGAVIPGATVSAVNPETGFTRTVTTDSVGNFRLTGLPIGQYSVRAEKEGFNVSQNPAVSVTVGTDTNIRFTLETGQISVVVSVTSAGDILESNQGQVTKSIGSIQIRALPGSNTLNGLALLSPGVLPNAQGRPGSGFAVNGNRTRSNNFTIDGANNNDQSLSIPRQALPFDALEEFTMVTNTPSAEFGRNSGSYVNQITRSGTNRFSGSGFWTWGGNSLNALTTAQQRTFNGNVATLGEEGALRSARSVAVDNSYGFTLGGPIKKDHTFFFVSMDFNDFRQTVGSATRTAFSPLAIQRLQYPGRTGIVPQALDFLVNRFPAANTSVAQGGVALTGNLALASCPVNDPIDCNFIPFTQYNRFSSGGVSYGTDFNRYMFKGNTRLTRNDNLSIRYLYDKFVNPGAPTALSGEEIGQLTKNDSLTINDSYIISSKWLNEARFTFSRRDLSFPEDLDFAFSVAGAPMAFGNQNYPQFRNDKVYEITDNVSYTLKDHSIKFGYNLLIYQLASFFAPNFDGLVSYGSLSNFLTDTNASYSRYAGDGLTDATTYENSFFFQDNWRVNPDLNLNLGLRYEYVTTPYGFFSNATSDINNFGPRFGIAWNPKNMFDGRFVLRGGFGISYDQVFQNVLLNNSRNYPRGVNVAFTNITGALPFLNLPVAPTPEEFTGNPLLLATRLFSPNERVKQPMSKQWTVSTQYQLGTDWVAKAEYIGNNGSNLIREIETNYGYTTASGGTGLRLDPTRGSILIGQGMANSSYHSGQFTIEKRNSRLNLFGANFGDLVFNANYTYSAFISEADDVLGGQANRTLPADPTNPQLDKARSGFDQPHRFVTNFVWSTPDFLSYGSGNFGERFAARIVNGWQFAAIGTYASGTPFSVLNANNALGILPGQISTVELSQRVSVNPNGIYPQVSTPTNPNPNAYFIVNAANSGILGNLGANTERTGTTQNWDLAAAKTFRLFGDRHSLQLRADMFNLFNHRNFTLIPANTIGNTVNTTTFLNLGFTNVGGRTMTFGARYIF